MHGPTDGWIAGFLDGDGAICISHAGKWPFVYVVFSQHERGREALEGIQARYGGYLSRPSQSRADHMLRLDIKARADVARLLINIEPFLVLKRDKALRALQVIGDHPTGKRNTRWSTEEIQFVLSRPHATARELALLLRRPYYSVQKKRHRLMAPQ